MSFSLPNEVWQIVFSSGLRRKDVRSVCLVSRRFYELANTAEVWRAAMYHDGFIFTLQQCHDKAVYASFHMPTTIHMPHGPAVTLSRYGRMHLAAWKYETSRKRGVTRFAKVSYSTSFTGTGLLMAEHSPKKAPPPGSGRLARNRRKWALQKRFHVVHAHRLARGLLRIAKTEHPESFPYSIPARVDNDLDFQIL